MDAQLCGDEGDLVGVVHSEDVPLELLCVSTRVALLHHGME